MPSKNIIKTYAEDQYYHVYNRGVNKSVIFKDAQDYLVFLSLFKRHLSSKADYSTSGRAYKHLANEVALLSYCLMTNHFHLLLLNLKSTGVEQLMRSIATAYSMYFNKKYSRVGPLFQSNFKASLVDSESYIQHISRYIHLNPFNYQTYKYSSYLAVVKQYKIEWLATERLLETFEGTISDYEDFVADHESNKAIMDELKYELADQT